LIIGVAPTDQSFQFEGLDPKGPLMFRRYSFVAILAVITLFAAPHPQPLQAAEPVHKGRAVFVESKPEFPRSYWGTWALDPAGCGPENQATKGELTAKGYIMGDGAMSIIRARLNPADAPRHDRMILDVVYEGGGGSEAATVIVQKNADGQMFRLWQRGEEEATATSFYRCPVKKAGGRPPR
jgi:hypothetical protein